MKSNFENPSDQSGAALIVALILLVTLSVMAISSMNTASLDLIMAGNEQYHARAFNVAEAGIERGIAINNFNPQVDPTAVTPTLVDSVTANNNNDKYSYVGSRPLEGKRSTLPPSYSGQNGAFSAYYFRIQSTGTSERGSTSVNTQELFVLAQGPPEDCNSPCGAL